MQESASTESIKKVSSRIIEGDCLDELRKLETDSVDLVFTSPPYEDARTYGIDFKLKDQAWVDWCFERFAECLRVCKGLVAFNVEGKTRDFKYSATPHLLAADLHRAGFNLRKDLIFNRVGIPGSGSKDWLRNDFEFIICATRKQGQLPWSDNTAMGHPPKWAPGGEMSHFMSDGTRKNQWGGSERSTGGERKKDGSIQKKDPKPSHVVSTIGRDEEGNPLDQNYVPPALANPGNIIKCTTGGGQMGSKLAYENEAAFPERLAEHIVRPFCPPNGIVLDPFCGSGTTGKVALKHGRSFIGIDIRPEMTDLTERRIDSEAPTLFMGAADE